MRQLSKYEQEVVKVGNVLVIHIGILVKLRQRLHERRQRRSKLTRTRKRETFFWSTITLVGVCLKIRRYHNKQVAVWLRSYKSEYDAVNGFVIITAPNVLRIVKLRSTKFTTNLRANIKPIVCVQNRNLRKLRKKFSL